MCRSRAFVSVLAALVLFGVVGCLKSTYHDSFDLDPDAVLETSRPVTVTRIAAEIDLLERHIEWYGSIVPKRPDVWGQARLMAHRYEYEQQLAARLDDFTSTINAKTTRVDQAMLATAVALGIGASAPKAEAKTKVNVASATTLSANAALEPPTKGEPAVATTIAGVTSLEPTIDLNQRSRYLNHLHQLRRINEGDDNADAPGYALNLVRIPVSILTGAHTDKGYGAELTATASVPYDDELLPTTFRNMVIGDLVDLFALSIANFIGAEDVRLLVDAIRAIDNQQIVWETRALPLPAPSKPSALPMQAPLAANAVKVREKQVTKMFLEMRSNAPAATADPRSTRFSDLLGSSAVNVPTRQRVSQLSVSPSQIIEVFGEENAARIIAGVYRSIRSHVLNDDPKNRRVPYHLDIQGALTDELEAAYRFLNQDETQSLWGFCSAPLTNAIRRRDMAALRQLRERFDEQIDNLVPRAQEIVTTKSVRVLGMDTGPLKVWRYSSDSLTACLAWAVVVQSALLEQRLHDDITALRSKAKGPALPADTHCGFHGPNPGAEARKVFHDYVQARWPIYVFALDPVTDEQNVGDKYSEVREAQLAVAVAFAAGQINGAAAMNYMRKLSRDIETISLHRTVVGFAHGERTFGWRFYPRVQTPPFQGTLATVGSLISPPDDKRQLNREARLENGARECVAIMVMPSFVPYVDFEFASHWFNLNDTKHRRGTATTAMRMSRRVQCLRTLAPKCADASKYRAGDIALLLNRLEQLSARLPFSQQRVNVPYENTSGGFELFNNGITDLGPELHGWYGAPGINQGGTTTLFLVGDNFSVHQTRVVVGGVQVTSQSAIHVNVQPKGDKVEVTKAEMVQNPSVELLSRQLLRITIPANTLHYVGSQSANRVVDIHVATPYGVSRHLSIPVYCDIVREREPAKSTAACPAPKSKEPAPVVPVSAAALDAPDDTADRMPVSSTTSSIRPNVDVVEHDVRWSSAPKRANTNGPPSK